MSHSPKREEKDCLNCGTIVVGDYCHNCGQENIIPKETFWHMFVHFIHDITHFDGSFFTTMKDLLFKPGFLTKEYMSGRRKAYLHPVRMYVFISFIFFPIFFSLFNIKESDVEIQSDKGKTKKSPTEIQNKALVDKKTEKDSIVVQKAKEIMGLTDSLVSHSLDSSGKLEGKIGPKKVSLDFGSADKYSSVSEYDSLQKKLLKKDKDGLFMKTINRRLVYINEKYRGRESKLMTDIGNKFLHSIPYLLFVSLPLYALFLKLLYRRQKKFYYADHAVFLIHLYIFTFLFLLIYFGLDRLSDKTHWSGIGFAQSALIFVGLIYTLKGMRNFYEQKWGSTIAKFLLFNILCIVAATILFALFALFSVFQI